MAKDKELKETLERLTELLSGAELSYADLMDTYEKVAKVREKKKREEIEQQKRQQEEEHKKTLSRLENMELPLSFENSFITETERAESVADGLIMSIRNLGRVDIEYISRVSGESMQNVISSLKGAIYQNPEAFEETFFKGFETADSYLSGNLMRKLRVAEAANERYNGYFTSNVEALKAALPPQCTANAYVTLGSPWLPPKVVDRFIVWLLGAVYNSTINGELVDSYKTTYEKLTGTWNIPFKNRYGYSVRATKTYGTNRLPALHIIEKTLNQQSIAIYDEVESKATKSGKKRVLNQHETINACDKQTEIIRAFQRWVWADEERKLELESIFHELYGTSVRRNFNGSFLQLPNINKDITLRPYQKNAVAKILFTDNVLLAHEVGAGKTFVMVAACMELRRIGLSKKNLFVVPNNILAQWKSMFKEIYPTSNVLVISPNDFTPEKRLLSLKRIRDEDYDAVLMAYSSFEMIDLSAKHRISLMQSELAEVKKAMKESSSTKLSSRMKAIEKEIASLGSGKGRAEIFFDELGITTLFIDEAHNYKNLPIESKTGNILGLNKAGSQKCKDTLEKVRCVQKNGRGVVFATGTPITNSITDVFVMQTYLQYGELKLLKLDLFDNWIGMFAEKVDEFEIDVTTSGYRVGTRFSRFHNLPELTSLLAQVADFLHAPNVDDLPEFNGYTDKLIPKTANLESFIQDISDRADRIRMGLVSRTDDNMLKITTDGRKAALDMRLIDINTPFTLQSKSAVCAETVAHIHRETAKNKSTQLIFCDTSVPSDTFNLYTDIHSQLIREGVPEHEIAFIHSYNTERQKEELFNRMASGAVRVLLGSTFKLGIGVNVQQKLVAIHHLDIPWRPSDMVQREGRILRQGNENSQISIYRYITEGSFDAYSWQLLEIKQRFIVDILSGFSVARTSSDIDSTVLNYAEVKALAIGNPLIKERIETVNELMRVNSLAKNHSDNMAKLSQELRELPHKIEMIKANIKNAELDLAHYLENAVPIKNMVGREEIRVQLQNAITADVMLREDTPLFHYQGFKVVLPANMISTKPSVYVVGNGRYYVELSGSDRGNLIRIDHCLNSLQDYALIKKSELLRLEERKQEVELALSEKTSYGDTLTQLRLRIKEIDKQLGVQKKKQ